MGINITFAQTGVQLSKKHINKVNKQGNASKKLALYRKYFKKDSTKQAKELERYWQARTDSLSEAIRTREKALDRKRKAMKDGINSKIYNTVYKPWARQQSRKHLQWLEKHDCKISNGLHNILLNYLEQYFLQATQNDSLLTALCTQMPDIEMPKQLSRKVGDFKLLDPIKAVRIQNMAKQIGNAKGAGELQAATGKMQLHVAALNEYGRYGSLMDADSLKGMAKSRGEEMAMNHLSKTEQYAQISELKNYQEQVSKLQKKPAQYQSQMKNLQDSAFVKEQVKKKAEEAAMKYITEHPEVMRGVQKKMSLLMKKYSVIPNSNDLSTAVKRTSLHGRKFKERLYFAGNFQVISLKPFSIDFSPMAGYRFNTRFLMGIGGNYRQSFTDSIPTLSPSVLGYKAFSSYDIVRNFFAYAEFARNSPGVKGSETGVHRTWRNAAFLGVGRKFMIRPKIEMTIVMMYNFLHEHKDPIYPRPWSMKIGFQTSELALFKPKQSF